MEQKHLAAQVTKPALILIGLLAIATTLRAPILGVGPLVQTLQSELSLTRTMAGFITAFPLIALGLIAPFAGKLSRYIGFEKSIVIALLIMIVGVCIRSAGQEWQLYFGTVLIGVSIAIGNVLLPGMVKRDFPNKIAKVTGNYGMAIGLSAALTSATAVPLMNYFGWQTALACSLIFPGIALLLVTLRIGREGNLSPVTTSLGKSNKNVWSSILGWQVTLFMSLNSIIFYAIVTWLPSILTDAGNTREAAGSIHGFMQLASIVPGLVLGPIVARMKDQRIAAALLSILQLVALGGFIYQPSFAFIWAFMFGMGSGGALILSLMFIGLRTSSPQEAASLSGMAQCVNFLIGAFGPALAGKMYALSGSWLSTLYAGILLAAIMALVGIFAGRNKTI